MPTSSFPMNVLEYLRGFVVRSQMLFDFRFDRSRAVTVSESRDGFTIAIEKEACIKVPLVDNKRSSIPRRSCMYIVRSIREKKTCSQS